MILTGGGFLGDLRLHSHAEIPPPTEPVRPPSLASPVEQSLIHLDLHRAVPRRPAATVHAAPGRVGFLEEISGTLPVGEALAMDATLASQSAHRHRHIQLRDPLQLLGGIFDTVVVVTARRTLGKHILSSASLSSGLGVGLSATLGASVALITPIFLGVLHVVVSADCRFVPREILWLAPTWCWCWSGYVNIGALVIIRFRQILVERRWGQEREHGVVVDARGHRTHRRRRNRRSRGSRRHWRSRRSRRRRRRRWLWRVWRYAAIPPVSCNT
ncbi:unnamed protein product, partial [Closterium sp. NIES-53]